MQRLDDLGLGVKYGEDDEYVKHQCCCIFRRCFGFLCSGVGHAVIQDTEFCLPAEGTPILAAPGERATAPSSHIAIMILA